jgi:L-ascorbate metabolism protein UlaG (beta-lactamase superfamily)
MRITLDWLGVATYRLVIAGIVIFLDAYVDRVPAAPPVGITTADIAHADYVLLDTRILIICGAPSGSPRGRGLP